MSEFFKKRKKRIPLIALVSAALTIVVFVEAPVEIYANNMGEMLFSLMDFLPFCLLLWLLFSAMVGAFLFLLPEKLYRAACPVAAAGAFLLFLQGTYLNLGLNTLPGDNMGGQTVSASMAALNALVWLAVVCLAAGTALVKKRGVSQAVSILLAVLVIGTQLADIVFVFATTDEIAVSKYERGNAGEAYCPMTMVSDGLTTLGGDGNIVVFIVDRFDETFAEGALEKDPGVFDELTGFTWFQDNISLYPHTYPSVAWMLTGKQYSCDMSREDYLTTAYEGDTPLKALSDDGYAIDLFTQSFYAFCDENDLPDYVENVIPNETFRALPAIYRLGTAAKMVQASMYRCFPFVLKDAMGRIDTDFSKFYRRGTRPGNEYTLDMKAIYDQLTASDFTVSEGKRFSFIHISGSHDFDYDMNWQTPSGEEANDHVLSTRVSFLLIDRYLQEMKRLGLYDGATIVITGDHADAYNSAIEIQEPRLTALFVKPAGSGEGPVRVSRAQVSAEEFWATVFQSEGLPGAEKYGESVFDVPEGVDQLRRHCWITWKTPMDEYDYVIDGPGDDLSNWRIEAHRVLDKHPTD